MIKTYRGSCHCGAVKFETELDLALGTYKCNCSICAKTRYWGANVEPGAFRLLSGESALTDYRFNTRRMQILFCKRCGVAPFTRGEGPEPGSPILSVNAAALDNVSVSELVAGPVAYLDGLHDNWDNAPDETRHL